MTFLTIVMRSLVRRPVRTGLTLVGIAIGIAAVVALVGISQGYEKSVEQQLDTIGMDLLVSDMTGGISPKIYDASVAEQVGKLPEVKQSASVLMHFLSVEEVPFMMVSGREWGNFGWEKLTIVQGRMPKDANEHAVVLGTMAADLLKKKVGDRLQLEALELNVVGIVDGHSVVDNGAAILSLPVLQEARGEQGKINFVNVRVTKGLSADGMKNLIAEIKKIYPGGRATPTHEVVNTSQGFKVVRAMSWSTSLLAIIVGVLGVMNTMLMTVFERTHEIGIFLAVGWKRFRIVMMVLCESALLGFFGGIFGVIVGIIGLKIMEHTVVRGMLQPDTSLMLLVKSVCIAVIVGVVSGLYPAWRSSLLSPAVALHAE
jgi:putative ABC transport system permease protein